jgi:hypothetical protein
LADAPSGIEDHKIRIARPLIPDFPLIDSGFSATLTLC